jgi:hypothetical protein
MKYYISSLKYILMNIICTIHVRYVFQHLSILPFVWRKLAKLLAWLTTTPCITTLFHVYHDFPLLLLRHDIKICQERHVKWEALAVWKVMGENLWLRFFMLLFSPPEKCQDYTSNYVTTTSLDTFPIIPPFYVHGISHWQLLKHITNKINTRVINNFHGYFFPAPFN